MKRLIPKSEIDKAKKELRDDFTSRIIKNINDKGCWHLYGIEKSKPVDFLVHFSERGTKKYFLKPKDLLLNALMETCQKASLFTLIARINIVLILIIIIRQRFNLT